MTIEDLNNRLTIALKKFIKDIQWTDSKGKGRTGHIDTGEMYKTVRFTAVDNGELKIKMKSKSYIQYLDKRKFMTMFFELPSTKAIIKEYLMKSPKSQISRDMMLKLFRNS